MNGSIIHVTAPSRLHFGMLAVNAAGTRRYGGAGVMIAAPRVRVSVGPAPRLEVAGPRAERASQVARFALGQFLGDEGGCREPDAFPCRIEVLECPPEHIGLGTGTQFSMAVVAGLNAFLGRPPLDARQLARCAGRGQRSAIGLYGFVHGGLLFEAGKTEAETVSPLVERVEMPAAWRFVLIIPRDQCGLSGESERAAFAQLPRVPAERTAALRREVLDHLLPAAAAARFEEFSQSMYRFGYTAGLSFAAIQGGAFAGPRLTELVEAIRRMGIGGVGQSSWGPTLFALLPDDASAADFTARLRGQADDCDVLVAAANNWGARTEIEAAMVGNARPSWTGAIC